MDRDTKYAAAFRAALTQERTLIAGAGVEGIGQYGPTVANHGILPANFTSECPIRELASPGRLIYISL